MNSISHVTQQNIQNSAQQRMVIVGSLDALAVEIMRPRLDALVGTQQDVVLDFTKVDFVDSSGIGAIVFLFKRLRAEGHSLCIEGAKGQPLELFKHLHIDRSIPVSEMKS